MSQRASVQIEATIVGKPSMSVRRAVLTLPSKQWPSLATLFRDVDAMCNEQPFRIYWRHSEQEYIPIYSFIRLRGALNLMYSPEIYVVTEEQQPLQKPASKFNSPRRDIDVLQLALRPRDSGDDLSAPFDYLRGKSPKLLARELRESQRQLDVLAKGHPLTRPKATESSLPRLKKDQPDASKKKLRKQ